MTKKAELCGPASATKRWDVRRLQGGGLLGSSLPGQEPAGRLVRGDDELYVGLAAHAVDGTGPASSGGVLVASGLFGHNRDGAVRAADDGSRRIKRRCGAKVDDEAYVFAGALPLDCGS